MVAPMRRILVLGATSAIAAEACALWAARGDRLHLVGRSADKLAAVAAECERRGAEVTTARADLQESAAAGELVDASIAALGGQIDLAFIAHGDLGDQLLSEREYHEAARILEINLLSAIALVVPLANALERQRGGALAVITSVAGERGRPRNYTYGAAKGALGLYLQGVRSRLYRAGVQITTIKLGPVDTPMTRDHDKNALFVGPARAAREIVRAIDRGAREAYVPWYWRPIMAIVRRTPEALFQRLRFLSGR